MKYTIKFKANDQDNVNYFDIKDPKNNMPSFLDYNEVLNHSIKNGNIQSKKEIVSLCDGGDHIEAFFSSNSASYEVECELDYHGIDFDESETVYEILANEDV